MSAKLHPGQLALAAGVTLLGIAIGIGAYFLPEASGYSGVGPRLFPSIVAVCLVPLGIFLLREALSGGFHDVDEQAEAANPTNWRAFGWISASLLVNGALMTTLGFVLSGVVLFVLAARGFDSRKPARDAIIGAAIALAAYGFFNYVLGLGLPSGVLPF